MGSTLQEQFLKMGLVDKKHAQSVKKTQHEQKKGQKTKGSLNESAILARQAQAEKKERDQLLNQKKNEQVKEQETAARIRQLIETNRLPMEKGDTPYNFTDDNKIRRLLVPKEMAERLSKGKLAIIRLAGEYQIVPDYVAEKVRAFNTKLIVVHHAPSKASPDHEDPYAEFQIPDDLIW